MKMVLISWLALLIPMHSWAEEEMYLEGISVIGAKKSAYLSVEGVTIAVKEGDILGDWQIAQIGRESVFLTTKGDKGETTELPLHARLPLIPAIPPEEMLSQDATGSTSPPPDLSTVIGTPMVTEGVPPGHRKIRTPFGDILVEEKLTPDGKTQVAPVATTPATGMPTIPDDAVPPGHRKVRTPFGDVLVKEEKSAELSNTTP